MEEIDVIDREIKNLKGRLKAQPVEKPRATRLRELKALRSEVRGSGGLKKKEEKLREELMSVQYALNDDSSLPRGMHRLLDNLQKKLRKLSQLAENLQQRLEELFRTSGDIEQEEIKTLHRHMILTKWRVREKQSIVEQTRLALMQKRMAIVEQRILLENLSSSSPKSLKGFLKKLQKKMEKEEIQAKKVRELEVRAEEGEFSAITVGWEWTKRIAMETEQNARRLKKWMLCMPQPGELQQDKKNAIREAQRIFLKINSTIKKGTEDNHRSPLPIGRIQDLERRIVQLVEQGEVIKQQFGRLGQRIKNMVGIMDVDEGTKQRVEGLWTRNMIGWARALEEAVKAANEMRVQLQSQTVDQPEGEI
jgi:hypothetical protein